MSPVSRVRRKDQGPRPAARAADAEKVRAALLRQRRLVRVGIVLMILAVGIAVEHALAHLGAFGAQQPSVLIDMGSGWPLAAVLFLVGAMLAGQRR